MPGERQRVAHQIRIVLFSYPTPPHFAFRSSVKGLGFVEVHGYNTLKKLDSFLKAVSSQVSHYVNEIIPHQASRDHMLSLMGGPAFAHYGDGLSGTVPIHPPPNLYSTTTRRPRQHAFTHRQTKEYQASISSCRKEESATFFNNTYPYHVFMS